MIEKKEWRKIERRERRERQRQKIREGTSEKEDVKKGKKRHEFH